MHYIAWDARMTKPTKTGGSIRDNLEVAAERGNRTAIKLLTPPFERPRVLDHLWIWHQQLRRGQGEDEHGTSPLIWPVFESWKNVMHARPYVYEIFALFDMDLIHRHPDAVEKIAPRRTLELVS